MTARAGGGTGGATGVRGGKFTGEACGGPLVPEGMASSAAPTLRGNGQPHRSCGGWGLRRLLACWEADPASTWRCLDEETARAARTLRLPPGTSVTREDLAHEILVRAFGDECRALRRARPETPVGRWVRGVGRNLAHQALAVRRLLPLDGLEPPDARDDALRRVEAADEKAALVRACEALPAKQRLVVTLVRHGLTPSQILEVHRGWEPRICARTVRWRTQRALDELGTRGAQRPRVGRVGGENGVLHDFPLPPCPPKRTSR